MTTIKQLLFSLMAGILFAATGSAADDSANSACGNPVEPSPPPATRQPETAQMKRPDLRAEIHLCDGSSLFCTIQARALSFAPTFAEKIPIPLKAVKFIEFGDDDKTTVIHFDNGDRLTGALLAKTIRVRSLLGRFEIDVRKIKRIVIKPNAAPDAKTAQGLLYWNTFDSPDAIRSPRVGPKGAFVAGTIVEGKMGQALKTNGARDAISVDFPAGAFRNKGCIEFWARIDDPTRLFSGGGYPRLFTATTGNWGFWLEYNINNGHGMGGLCAGVASRPCGIPRSFMGGPQPYGTVLKSNPGGWHHYALVWNDEGLKNINASDGRPATFAVLLDGKMYSSRNFEGMPGSFAAAANGPVFFGVPHPNVTDYRDVSFSIDELKIWNYDKTEFE